MAVCQDNLAGDTVVTVIAGGQIDLKPRPQREMERDRDLAWASLAIVARLSYVSGSSKPLPRPS